MPLKTQRDAGGKMELKVLEKSFEGPARELAWNDREWDALDRAPGAGTIRLLKLKTIIPRSLVEGWTQSHEDRGRGESSSDRRPGVFH